MSKKVAFITGISGQDGSILAELLLQKDYKVYGLIRRSSTFNTVRIEHIYNHPNLKLIYGDISDSMNISTIIRDIQPDEIYNLAAQSHVKVSFDVPINTVDMNILGTINVLESIRQYSPHSKYYQASSSEMFGKVEEVPQTEKTPFHPRSPYGCSKVYSYWQTVNYREAYNIFASNGILFNHSGERRGETFVTRKITRAVTRIKLGLQNELILGNIDSKRDWGYYKDYCEAMYLILQHNKPDDFVIATGETHSVREFLEIAFSYLDLNYEEYVKIDQKYFRPSEVDLLLGDPSKAKRELNWTPKTSFKELVKIMVDSDMEIAKDEKCIMERRNKI